MRVAICRETQDPLLCLDDAADSECDDEDHDDDNDGVDCLSVYIFVWNVLRGPRSHLDELSFEKRPSCW